MNVPRKFSWPGRFALACLLFCSALPAAQTAWRNFSLGDWFVTSNWRNGLVPDASTEAFVSNGGTALLSAPGAAALALNLGVYITSPDPNINGSVGTLLVTGGPLNVGGNLEIGSSFTAGQVGQGTLTISAGGAVNGAGTATVASGNQGSLGTITVTGANSFLSLGALALGTDTGQATFQVQSGGACFSPNATLGVSAASRGTATVSGATSVWNVGTRLDVGFAGIGSLTISGGGRVNGATAALGTQAGSNGAVTITGASSIWSLPGGQIHVGGAPTGTTSGGTAELRVFSGGLIETSALRVFDTAIVEINNGTDGVPGLLLSGYVPHQEGGSLGDIVVGNTSGGRMEIRLGATGVNRRGFIGQNAGSSGAVVVTGRGTLPDDFASRWSCSGSLWIGNAGSGSLEISGGGVVGSLGNVYLGFEATAAGYLSVTGRLSFLSAAANLYVGGNGGGAGGSGTLVLADEGFVSATETIFYPGSFLELGAAPPNSARILGLVRFRGGNVQATAAATYPSPIILETGGLTVFTGGFPLEFIDVLSGPGGLNKAGGFILGPGTLTLRAINTYTGATAVSTGRLLIEGSIISATTVTGGATLGGNGTTGSVTASSGGIVAPGTSGPGRLTVNGNYTQTSSGVLAVELGGLTPASEFDQLAVSGSASVDGSLQLSLVGGFRPRVGDAFAILTAAACSGNFSSIQSPGFTVSAASSASGIVLTVTDVDPELIITSTALVATDVVITFLATAGKTYRLERNLTLNDPTWDPIAGVADLTAAANGSAVFTDPGAGSLPRAFYRVRLLP